MSGFSHILSDGMVFDLLFRLVLGAIASFLAIISWTKTRSLAWMMVIAGILASYAGTLYQALRLFGLFSGPEILFFGASLGSLVSENLPVVCYIVAFILFLRREN